MKTEIEKRKKFFIQKSKEAFQEASFLRSEITDKEKKKLDYDLLSSSSVSSCIYGLISGSCYSERASELMKKSKAKLFYCLDQESVFRNREKKLSDGFTFENRELFFLFSPLENFIKFNHNFNKDLVSFIKGEINLKEKDFVKVIKDYYK